MSVLDDRIAWLVDEQLRLACNTRDEGYTRRDAEPWRPRAGHALMRAADAAVVSAREDWERLLALRELGTTRA